MDIRRLIRSLFFTEGHFFCSLLLLVSGLQTYIHTVIHRHTAAFMQMQSVLCAKEAFRGLQSPSHFVLSVLKTHGPHVAGCHLLCNEWNLLQRHDYGLKVSFYSLTLLISSDNCFHFSCSISDNLTWWFWHCAACTIDSHVEGLEGSSVTWCIPLSV